MTELSAFKKLWMKALLRGVQFSDKYAKLNQFYRIEDPWQMDSPREQFRFDQTNQLILANFGRPERILEVGCGEGHQSVELQKIGSQLFGIDVSARAVSRAKERCPTASFAIGDLASPHISNTGAFDLVVACEVLYYMKDVRAALNIMNRLGGACFVSFVDSRAEFLEPMLKSIPDIKFHAFGYESTRWTAAWWTNRLD